MTPLLVLAVAVAGGLGAVARLVLDGVLSPVWQQDRRLAREALLFQAGRLRWFLLYLILPVLALSLYVGLTPGAR